MGNFATGDLKKRVNLSDNTEGNDWKILSQLDLVLYAPRWILFEYHPLETDDLNSAHQFLNPHYALFEVEVGILSVRAFKEVK